MVAFELRLMLAKCVLGVRVWTICHFLSLLLAGVHLFKYYHFDQKWNNSEVVWKWSQVADADASVKTILLLVGCTTGAFFFTLRWWFLGRKQRGLKVIAIKQVEVQQKLWWWKWRSKAMFSPLPVPRTVGNCSTEMRLPSVNRKPSDPSRSYTNAFSFKQKNAIHRTCTFSLKTYFCDVRIFAYWEADYEVCNSYTQGAW